MFTPLQTQAALFVPPFRSRFVLRSAPAWEKLGERWFPTFAGVVIVEAAKQIYAGSAVHDLGEATRRYMPIPQGFRMDPNSGEAKVAPTAGWPAASPP
jgi:hypothetical protein